MSDRDELAGLMKAHSDAAPLGTFKWRALADAILARWPLGESEQASELIADLSWRATRYAMDGKRMEHDVMTEALATTRSYLLGEDNGGRVPCACKFTPT